MSLLGAFNPLEGLSLGLFPEGTRSRTGILREFKKGSFVLAIETQLPLVPVSIDGGWRLASGRRLLPGTVRIRIGPPIPTASRTVEDRDDILREGRAEVERLLSEGRRETGDPTPVLPGADRDRPPGASRIPTGGPA